MFHIGRARRPGPGKRLFTPGQLSVEFVNLGGGWMVDLWGSCIGFLCSVPCVCEHWLISPRARPVCHQLREAGHQSVWSPSCQDQVAGGHTGVGVVSLGRAPLSLPSFVSAQFKEFFRLSRALRTTLPTGKGGVVPSFCSLWVSGRRMLRSCNLLISSFKLSLLKLRWFVLVSPCLLLATSQCVGCVSCLLCN